MAEIRHLGSWRQNAKTRFSGKLSNLVSCNIGILHLFSISTTSPQSTCRSAPVSEILSRQDHPRQKKMTSCRFSRWRISAILGFKDPIMGSLKSPITTSLLNCLVFQKIAFLHFSVHIQDGGSLPSWILGVPQWVLWKPHVRLPIGHQ